VLHTRNTNREDCEMPSEQLTIRQTPTGYWTVQRGGVHVAGSTTRRGAEAERELMMRLARRSIRRAATRVPAKTKT
jgi:hypothetical protein